MKPRFTSLALLMFTTLSGHVFANSPGFENHQDMLDKQYRGSTFQLRQDYPAKFPVQARPWEQLDFKKNPEAFLQYIRDYIYQGMADVDWRPERNQTHAWYSMPWVTQGRRAREAIRGLNRNADVAPKTLGQAQSQPIQKWEGSYYNPIAAYQIGKIWKNPTLKGAPDLTQTEFPEGSFIIKFIFVSDEGQKLPLLEGAPQVFANINANINRNSPKEVKPVHLVQMDFSIRDARADDTTSWVMGSFVYDKNAKGESGWLKMVPLGLMWGNDPNMSATQINEGMSLKETYVSNQIPDYAQKTLGYMGRLNGPMDQRGSSCLGCHSMAQWPNPMNKTPLGETDAQLRYYFRNLKPNEAFEKGRTSLDYQLHLENALRNYFKQN